MGEIDSCLEGRDPLHASLFTHVTFTTWRIDPAPSSVMTIMNQ